MCINSAISSSLKHDDTLVSDTTNILMLSITPPHQRKKRAGIRAWSERGEKDKKKSVTEKKLGRKMVSISPSATCDIFQFLVSYNKWNQFSLIWNKLQFLTSEKLELEMCGFCSLYKWFKLLINDDDHSISWLEFFHIFI